MCQMAPRKTTDAYPLKFMARFLYLCKGTDLYQTILPMVQQQVSSQIKVRDLSAAKLTISPSDTTSWQEALTELLSEAKNHLRAELETKLAATKNDGDLDKIKKDFVQREAMLEHTIDSTVHQSDGHGISPHFLPILPMLHHYNNFP